MAIFTPAGGIGSISGSTGGIVFSRNRGGPYTRRRAIPVNPGTPQQSAVRSFMSQLTSLWGNTLTAAQRAAWDTYALNVPLPNALGEPRNVGGLGMYIRSNVPRLQAAQTRIDDGPTVQNLGDYTAPTVDSVTSVGEVIVLSFDALDDWANEDDAAMLVYTSRAKSPTINFFKGPYRFAGLIAGDAVTPPVSPFPIVGQFPVAVGLQTFIRVTVSRADGRLSAEFRTGGTAV